MTLLGPGSVRGELLNKVADLLESNSDEIAALEALDNGQSTLSSPGIVLIYRSGKTFRDAKSQDVAFSIKTFRYYAGLAGKVYGKTIEVRIRLQSIPCSA